MRLLLVRHAIAADRQGFDGTDADRRLTAAGVARFERGAVAMAGLVPELEVVLTSPYARCRETAALLAGAHPSRPPVSELGELAPGGEAGRTIAALRPHGGARALALVGHEPDLSILEGALLTGRAGALAAFKKGGAALLELPGVPRAGAARLLWHLTAGQLRRLGG